MGKVIALWPTLIASSVWASEPPYVGSWASQVEYCKNDSNWTFDSPINITRKAVDGHEWHCDITSVVASSSGWTATMSCASEGDEERRTVRWRVSADGRLHEFADGESRSYVRCEGALHAR